MSAAKILDGKYEILEEIKRGGFGVISFGRDLLFDKPVAVKTIPPELLILILCHTAPLFILITSKYLLT